MALGLSTETSDRHGGPEHRYWVHRIADHLRTQGYKVSIERPIGNGKTIGILATRSGRKTAFEIETGNSNAIANVRKCLDAEVKRVMLVRTSGPVRAAVLKNLAPHPNVGVMTTYETAGWPVPTAAAGTARQGQ